LNLLRERLTQSGMSLGWRVVIMIGSDVFGGGLGERGRNRELGLSLNEVAAGRNQAGNDTYIGLSFGSGGRQLSAILRGYVSSVAGTAGFVKRGGNANPEGHEGTRRETHPDR
jgi:hypothetical protein